MTQRFQSGRTGNPLHLHEVSSGVFESRVAQAMGQWTVVGEQKQPFAITIEPANRVNPGNSQMILERRPSIGGGELAEDIEGFEQSEIAQRGALVAGRAG